LNECLAVLHDRSNSFTPCAVSAPFPLECKITGAEDAKRSDRFAPFRTKIARRHVPPVVRAPCWLARLLQAKRFLKLPGFFGELVELEALHMVDPENPEPVLSSLPAKTLSKVLQFTKD